MVSIIFALFLSNAAPQAVKSNCETYAPRLDGISVTVCDGRAVRYVDAAGNVSEPDKF